MCIVFLFTDNPRVNYFSTAIWMETRVEAILTWFYKTSKQQKTIKRSHHGHRWVTALWNMAGLSQHLHQEQSECCMRRCPGLWEGEAPGFCHYSSNWAVRLVKGAPEPIRKEFLGSAILFQSMLEVIKFAHSPENPHKAYVIKRVTHCH